jgi:hypothetical protein
MWVVHAGVGRGEASEGTPTDRDGAGQRTAGAHGAGQEAADGGSDPT